jgi:hypothetical protein
MKISMLALILFFSVCSQALTQGRFLGMQGMVTLTSQGPNGPIDGDAEDLFAYMNVPIQETSMGPGKIIKAENKVFNLLCANSKNQGYICSLVLNRSPHTKLSAKEISYEVKGVDALNLSRQFFVKGGKYVFKTTDNLFKIEVSEDHFLALYNARGVN